MARNNSGKLPEYLAKVRSVDASRIEVITVNHVARQVLSFCSDGQGSIRISSDDLSFLVSGEEVDEMVSRFRRIQGGLVRIGGEDAFLMIGKTPTGRYDRISLSAEGYWDLTFSVMNALLLRIQQISRLSTESSQHESFKKTRFIVRCQADENLAMIVSCDLAIGNNAAQNSSQLHRFVQSQVFAAVSSWLDTTEGAIAWENSSEDFNLGDLALVESNLDLIETLDLFGIKSFSVEQIDIARSDDWDFDDMIKPVSLD
jgi:hypothetical protein